MLAVRSATVHPSVRLLARLFSAWSPVRSGGGGGDTLGKRLLSLVYPKRSAVVEIAKWMEQGHAVQKYQLNRIVRELRKLKRYKHALEVCEWMTQQSYLRLVRGDYAVHLDLVAKIRGLPSAEKFFEDLPDKMRGHEVCSALLHVYAQNKLVDEAEALMSKMSECGFLKNPLPYNHMLMLYFELGQMDKLGNMVRELKKNVSPDTVTYNLLLSMFASKGDIDSVEKLFVELKMKKVPPDWLTYSTLANLYTKRKLYEKAASALKELEKLTSRRNRASYSSLLSLHASMGNRDDVYRIWKEMGLLFRKRNDAEYMCMISSLLKLEEFNGAQDLYKQWESTSGTRDPRVSNLMLGAYLNRGQMEEAEEFHRTHMLAKGIRSSYTAWELFTWGSLRRKQLGKALAYLEKAFSSVKSWDYNEKLIGEFQKNYEEQADIEGVERLLVLLRKAGHVNTSMYNSLLRTYEKAGKMPLIVTERMERDNVKLDAETHKLLKATSIMCISEVPSCLP